MRKLLFASAAALALTVSLAGGIAYADNDKAKISQSGTDAATATITQNGTGASIGSTAEITQIDQIGGNDTATITQDDGGISVGGLSLANQAFVTQGSSSTGLDEQMGTVTISQVYDGGGNGNTATVNQQTSNAAVGGTQTVDLDQNGFAHTADLTQRNGTDGSPDMGGNSIIATQTGNTNALTVSQTGDGGRIVSTQSADNNSANMLQDGPANYTQLDQSGSGNTTKTRQRGVNGDIFVDQPGDDNVTFAGQFGTVSNVMTVTQNGSGNRAAVVQNAALDLDLNGDPNGHTFASEAGATTAGGNNTATVLQNLDGGVALIEQLGSNDVALIIQQ